MSRSTAHYGADDQLHAGEYASCETCHGPAGLPAPGHKLNGFTVLAVATVGIGDEAVILCHDPNNVQPFVTARVHCRQGAQPREWHAGDYCSTIGAAVDSLARRARLTSQHHDGLLSRLSQYLVTTTS